MKCNKCGKDHKTTHPCLVSKLKDKGFPTHSKRYPSAHEEADKEEKRKFGSKQYHELEKFDNKLSQHELAGKNFKIGKVEISKKVPKKLRKEVEFHEKVENKILRKKKRK